MQKEREERELQRKQEQLREIQKKTIAEKMEQIAQTEIGKKVIRYYIHILRNKHLNSTKFNLAS